MNKSANPAITAVEITEAYYFRNQSCVLRISISLFFFHLTFSYVILVILLIRGIT